MTIRKKIIASGVFIPDWFGEYSDEELEEMGLQCGTNDGRWSWLTVFVPESIHGVEIFPACAMHDLRYARGGSEQDKLKADRLFLNDLLTLVNKGAEEEDISGIELRSRHRQAFGYYVAVDTFGDAAFNIIEGKQNTQLETIANLTEHPELTDDVKSMLV